MPPSEFWGLTPMELDALCEASIKSHPKYIEPITADEVETLMQRFPDARK